jgi:hypothetical protein
MWEMEQLRALIVSQLSATFNNEDAAEQIQLAQTYGIAKWVERSVQVLVLRPGSMTAREIETVGPETAAQIWSLRDRNRSIAAHESRLKALHKIWDMWTPDCKCKSCQYVREELCEREQVGQRTTYTMRSMEDLDYSMMMPEIRRKIQIFSQVASPA